MTGQTSAMMAVRDPDIRLMLRVRDQDDQAAFADLVARFQHRLVGIMHHLVGTADEAEDLATQLLTQFPRELGNEKEKVLQVRDRKSVV